jgi:hypothetical protein
MKEREIEAETLYSKYVTLVGFGSYTTAHRSFALQVNA